MTTTLKLIYSPEKATTFGEKKIYFDYSTYSQKLGEDFDELYNLAPTDFQTLLRSCFLQSAMRS